MCLPFGFNSHPHWTEGTKTVPRARPSSSSAAKRGRRPLDSVEAFLVATLPRYVTYCARGRRYAAMQGAAALLYEVDSRLSGQRNQREGE